MQKVVEKLRSIGLEVGEGLKITVGASELREKAEKLKSIGYDHVKSVTGIDYPDKGVFKIVYHVSSYSDKELSTSILSIEIETSRDNPEVPSLLDVWPSVRYLEAETSELLGVKFQGNPLEKVMLPDDFKGPPPLRKDFKIPVEGIEK